MTHPCGLHIVVAPTGSGKSMFMMQYLGHCLGTSNRTVVTNLPIIWEGLVEVMNELHPKEGEEWTLARLKERVWRCEDVGTLRRYWLQRGHGWTLIDIEEKQYEQDLRPDWSVCFRYREAVADGLRERVPLWQLRMPAVLALESRGEVERCSIGDIPPVQFLLDELGDLFPKMSGSRLGQGYTHYQRHKRKIGTIGDDTIGACQYAKQIDLELREQANDWMFLVNWAARRKGIFNLPKRATWAKYPHVPQRGDTPMLTGFFAIDGRSWGRTYDTSAGVGIEGGFQADKGQKVGGISWMWIPVAFVVALYFIYQSPRGISGIFSWFLQGAKSKPTIAAVGAPVPSIETNMVPKQTNTVPNKAVESEKLERRELQSIALMGGILQLYWRDGTVDLSTDRRFQGVFRIGGIVRGVRWEGQTYLLTSRQLHDRHKEAYSYER